MFIFWLLFRLVGISSISETGLFYVWIRSNILKRILHQIGQTSSFLIIDTVDPMKDNTTVHRGLSHTVSTKTTVQNHVVRGIIPGDCFQKRSLYAESVTVMLVTSLCWWLNDGDHFEMLVTKKYVGDIFLHVDDIPIGHQHHNMPECDVGNWYLILVSNSRCWWRDLSI